MEPGNGVLEFSWLPPTSEAAESSLSYVLWHRRAGTSGWQRRDLVGGATSAAIFGLTNGVGYEARLEAAVAGERSASGDLIETPRGDPPGPPRTVRMDARNAALGVSWQPPLDDGGDPDLSYVVEYLSPEAPDWGFLEPVKTTSAKIVDLENGAVHRVRVVAYSSGGRGEPSAEATETPVGVAPTAPTNVRLEPGNALIDVLWDPPSNDGNDPKLSYTVQYWVLGEQEQVESLPPISDSTRATVASLVNGATYQVQVAASNSGGRGLFSSVQPAIPRGDKPGVPRNVSLTAGNASLGVSWDSPSDDGGDPKLAYTVQYRVEDSGNPWTPVDVDATEATLEMLTNDTAYEVQVAASNSGGQGDFSFPETETPVGGTPGVPRSLVLAPGNGELAVSWSAPSDDGGNPNLVYLVQHRQQDALNPLNWTTLSDPSSGLSATVSGLTNGRDYEVRVAARNNADLLSQFTTPKSARPRGDKPGVPQGLTVTPGNAELEVSWSAPDDDGGDPNLTYVVQHRLTGAWTTLNVSALSTTITGLANGRVHQVRVAASNSGGQGPFTDPPEPATPFADPPGMPGVLTVTPGNAEVFAQWSEPINDGGDLNLVYELQYREAGDPGWTTHSATESGLSATVEMLTNNEQYEMQVAASNSGGQGPFTTPKTATPLPDPPGPPTSLMLLAGNAQLEVSWVAPADDGGDPDLTYAVQYRTSGTGDDWRTFTNSASASPVTVTSLKNGREHEVRVGATNSAGAGHYTEPATAMPVGDPPGTPTSLALTAGNAAIAVAWAAPDDDGGDSNLDYVVQYRVSGSNSAWTALGDAASLPLATVTGLANGTTYEVQVAASHAGGTSEFTESQTAAPASGGPSVPKNLNAGAGNATMNASWSPPDDDGGDPAVKYHVQFRLFSETVWQSLVAAFPLTSIEAQAINGNRYALRVAATNSSGQSLFTSPVAVLPRADPPGVPQSVDLTVRDGAMEVSWNAPADDGDDSGFPQLKYEVQYRVSGTGDSWTTSHSSTSNRVVRVARLEYGTSYDFRVAASHRGGQGLFTEPVSEVLVAERPGRPSNLDAVPLDGALVITWIEPADDGGDSDLVHELQYRSEGIQEWTARPWSSATAAHIRNLTNDISYEFKVRARNSGGEGDFGGSITAAPVAVHVVTDTTVPDLDVIEVQTNTRFKLHRMLDGSTPVLLWFLSPY